MTLEFTSIARGGRTIEPDLKAANDRGFCCNGRLGRFRWGICLECLIGSVADSVKLPRDTRKLIVISAVFAHLVAKIIATRTTIAAQ